jgi:hypothetical protein
MSDEASQKMSLAEKNSIYQQRYRAKKRNELGIDKYKKEVNENMQKYREQRHKREGYVRPQPVQHIKEEPLVNLEIPKQESTDGTIKKGIIYIIEHNTKSELRYIGQTKESLAKRWHGHLTTFKMYDKMFYRLGFFVNYYGVENFSIREYKIYKNISQDFLDSEEKIYIYELGTLNTQYCNENITIKITNELQNEFIKMLIEKEVNISNILKVIDTFQYNYKKERLQFVLNDHNEDLMKSLS